MSQRAIGSSTDTLVRSARIEHAADIFYQLISKIISVPNDFQAKNESESLGSTQKPKASFPK